MGGAYITTCYTTTYVDGNIAGRGFIALAAVIFGRWSAGGVLLACLFFGNLGAFAKQEEKTRFIAHRGFCSRYLENTEEAFVKAAEFGFDGCETDVRISADGVLMLAHGGSYVYADGTELDVATHTFAELTAKPLQNDFTDTVLYPCTFRRYIVPGGEAYRSVCLQGLLHARRTEH